MVIKIVQQVLDTCCGGNAANIAGVQTPWNKPEQQDIPETQQAQTNKIPNKKKKGKFTDKEMKYEVTVWKDLPIKVRKACQELGYDKDKWDDASAEPLPIEDKHWKDLTESEMKAVTTLGWEEETWENQYEEYEYKDLPELQKKAAEAVGITDDEKWEHWPHDLEHNHWDELTEQQKQAMAVFGWHKSLWDDM